MFNFSRYNLNNEKEYQMCFDALKDEYISKLSSEDRRNLGEELPHIAEYYAQNNIDVYLRRRRVQEYVNRHHCEYKVKFRLDTDGDYYYSLPTIDEYVSENKNYFNYVDGQEVVVIASTFTFAVNILISLLEDVVSTFGTSTDWRKDFVNDFTRRIQEVVNILKNAAPYGEGKSIAIVGDSGNLKFLCSIHPVMKKQCLSTKIAGSFAGEVITDCYDYDVDLNLWQMNKCKVEYFMDYISKEKPDCSVVSFIDDCIRGDSSPCDIDKYVEYWHNNPQIPYTLREFLGFTEEEYEEYRKSNSVAFVERVIQKRIDSALSRLQKDSNVEVIKVDL